MSHNAASSDVDQAFGPNGRHGPFIVVLGPSGVGKDSLLAYARERFADNASVMFVRRVVTRDGDASENHDTMSVAAFEAARLSARFAVTWQAHGLCYGIPADARAFVNEGGVAVANGSRAALADICAAFPNVLTVSVTADPEVIKRRLSARGREDAVSIALRLQRGTSIEPAGFSVQIDNSGDLALAGDQLTDIISTRLRLAATLSGGSSGIARQFRKTL